MKSKYVDDSKITDHYAIIPTGEGKGALASLTKMERGVYEMVVNRFLAIFYPPAKYSKVAITTKVLEERFLTSQKVLVERGYLDVLGKERKDKDEADNEEASVFLSKLRKGEKFSVKEFNIKEGETSPPKRYTTGSIIIAMENAGKLIEDDELREHIKGQGIGTSATRAEIIKKLINIEYLTSNSKTQVLTPSRKGEMIYESIKASVPSLLNPTLTASWEKGLKLVYDKEIQPSEFMNKLESYTRNNISRVMNQSNISYVNRKLMEVRNIYSES